MPLTSQGLDKGERRRTSNDMALLRTHLLVVGVVLVGVVVWQGSFVAIHACAQSVAERLKQGVDNPDSAKSKVRGGSDSDPKENMKKLLKPIMSDSGGEIDKWYSPHLRDLLAPEQGNRDMQAKIRSEAGAKRVVETWCSDGRWGYECSNGLGGPTTACKICQPPDAPVPGNGCPGQAWVDEHVYPECCRVNTAKYESFVKDYNYKTCCVLEKEENRAEEWIACEHPQGDGWAGMFEYYYPTLVFGWENDRSSTMLASKDEVQKCVEEADSLMEGESAQKWVAGAIERIQKAAGGGSTGGGDVQNLVAQDIKKVRPQDKKLRFSDSLQGEGLTVRFNLASLDDQERKALAKHFCMRPAQFDKLLMPDQDILYTGDSDLSKQEYIFANYCENGVELMIDPANSSMPNPDKTKTDFKKGYQAWVSDPLYCQRMNSSEVNMGITKIKDVIEQSGGGGGGDNGNTCYEGGKLNGGMVPVTLYRHAAVERRTAISDHAMGFLIASALKGSSEDLKSLFKRFEPLPYSKVSDRGYKIFWGKPFKASGQNEIDESCKGYQPREYRGKDTSDQLFISDFTHKPFTQDVLVNVGDDKNVFNKYRQKWAKEDGSSEKDMPKRGLDEKGQNYGAAFRKFATCPLGYVRWRNTQDPTLTKNVDYWCGEENFGSPKAHKKN